MNMNDWLKSAASKQKPMPILSFPGIQLTGVTVNELVKSGKLQAECMKAIADRFDTLASVSLMDLSVEAEAFGSPIHFSADEVPTVTGAIIADENDLDNLAVPSIGTARTGEYVNTIREAKKLITDRPVFAGAIGPYSLAGRLMDMTEIMMLCYEEPELVHGVMEKATQFLIAYNTALRDAGADGLIMAEPASGMLSPPLMEEFSTPYVARIIAAVETVNCVFVYHNCGNSTIALVKHILATGAKAFHFGNAIDLAEMIKLIPSDRIVMGNIDPVSRLRNGTPESVRTVTFDLLSQCGDYSNFILSSGCDIPPVTSLENLEALFSAAKEHYHK